MEAGILVDIHRCWTGLALGAILIGWVGSGAHANPPDRRASPPPPNFSLGSLRVPIASSPMPIARVGPHGSSGGLVELSTGYGEHWLPEPGASPTEQAELLLTRLLRLARSLLAPLLQELGFETRPPELEEPAPPPPSAAQIALYENDEVRKFMRMFLDSHRQAFSRGLARAGQYIPMMQTILREEGVPADLAYLAIVESNLDPRALSPKRAAGLWQFMRTTARHFRLRVEPWYDERQDPILSTRAAARLLRHLHKRFGSWELALAAYNAGEGRVKRAMRASRALGKREDFWNLSLPLQTRRYVPSFMAVALIYNNLEVYGFGPLEPEAFLKHEVVRGRFVTTLDEIAKRIDVSARLLWELNPAWKQGLIPPNHRGNVLLRVPPGGTERLKAALAKGPLPLPDIVSHRVVRGETLSQISRRYGVPMSALLAVNRIPNRNLVRYGRILLIPLSHAGGGTHLTAREI